MRLTVQQLVRGHAAAQRFPPVAQRIEEKSSVSIDKPRRLVSIRYETLSGRDSLREVRCIDLNAAHRRM
jgi:hypothetical protein